MDQFGLPAGKSPRFSSTFTENRNVCLSWGLLALVTCGGAFIPWGNPLSRARGAPQNACPARRDFVSLLTTGGG
jgi:hypothetical protein